MRNLNHCAHGLFICSVTSLLLGSRLGLAADSVVSLPMTTPNRSVFFNGIDISSARNQDLRNVHIKISDNGDIYISGPQYQVTEEETFMPLSQLKSKTAAPEHLPPQQMGGASKTAKAPGTDAVEKSTSNGAAAPTQPASPSTPK